ncbi:MAG: hypothetical protein KAW12_08370 [Candidatus Aminicenantes bacterium]|nr:hypothetical protein [Candidatus Aminicenantes bacterium]
MNRIKNQWVLKAVIGVFIVLAFSFNSFSWIYHNHGGSAYVDGGEGIAAISSSIETYIIDGAGYFLKSYADVLILLNYIETTVPGNLDQAELQEVVENALTNLNSAKSAYTQLITLAEATPYNVEVLEKLKFLDYDSFIENNGLIPVVFKDVEKYLKKGDITGTLKKSAAAFDMLVSILKTIEADIALGNMPDINSLWNLNQEYAKELLFGQYTARVYYAL